MARPTKLMAAKDDIFAFFDKSQKIFSRPQLARILSDNRACWRLSERTSVGEFIAFLKRQGSLKEQTFQATNYNRSINRYSWGRSSIYELAQSLRAHGYFSHATAAALHRLIDPIPKTLFVNVEQSPKPSLLDGLTQRGIDMAFARKQRRSNLIYKHKNWFVTVINGKHTNALGVEELIGAADEQLRATSLERTLIDMVVRPTYAGGISRTLEAYRAAKDRVSVRRLVETLKKLDYVYPYHQAIGFLMEQTGYDEKSFSMFRQLGLDYDFYLAHGVKQPNYSSDWRLFYPENFNQEQVPRRLQAHGFQRPKCA